jgi:hypothetical protein
MTKYLVIFFALFVVVACNGAISKTVDSNFDNGNIQPLSNNKAKEDCVKLDFHYLITSDSMTAPNLRLIRVFLDEKAFSEENLKELFNYLSNKYSEPNNLVIQVNTAWAQLPLPSDCPGGGISNQPDRTDKYDYHQAIFYRGSKAPYFKYNPVLGTSNFKEVVLKDK